MTQTGVKGSGEVLPAWQYELDQCCRSWEGTPYMHGQSAPGMGADCVGFVAGVLDELHGGEFPPLERGPIDVAWHDEILTAAVVRNMERRWPNMRINNPLMHQIEPGDVLLCRVGRSDGGHVMLAGTRKNTVWHSDHGAGVCYSGFGVYWDKVIRAYRCTEREKWRRR